MIKLLVTVACCVVVAMPVIQAQTILYSTKYDNMNYEEILKNDRLLNNYFKCLIDTGKCTAEGELLKQTLPEAIENNCANCSEKQKIGANKVVKFLFENKNDLWKQLEAKYDPQETYRQRYKENLKELNIES